MFFSNELATETVIHLNYVNTIRDVDIWEIYLHVTYKFLNFECFCGLQDEIKKFFFSVFLKPTSNMFNFYSFFK